MDDLNKQFFETKKKYKEGIRKKTIFEKIIFTIIALLISYFFYIYKRNNDIKEIEDKLVSEQFIFNKKDTLLNLNNLNIFVPKSFSYFSNKNDFVFYSKKNEKIVVFVDYKDVFYNNMLTTFKTGILGTKNKFNIISSKLNNYNDVLIDLDINSSQEGTVKLMKLNNNKMYVLFIIFHKDITSQEKDILLKVINNTKIIPTSREVPELYPASASAMSLS